MLTRDALRRGATRLTAVLATGATVLAVTGWWATPPADAATPSFDLYAGAGTTTLPGGQTMTVWGYDSTAGAVGRPGGPTLTVGVGDQVTITLHNGVGEPTGLFVQGQPMVPDLTGVAAGGTRTYTFTAENPGTYLYEAAPIPGAQHQSAMGLYGALVVQPAATGQAYGDAATAYDADQVLLLGELDPALNGSANPAAFDMRKFAPRYFTVNGRAYPDTQAITATPDSTELLRYVNAGMSYHSMAVLGADQAVIAVDGAPLSEAHHQVAETVGPGQTLDTLVHVPAAATVDTELVVHDASMTLHNGTTRAVGGMLTSVVVPGNPSPTDTTGPALSGAAVAGGALTATADDRGEHGGSNIQAVEAHLDAVGGATITLDAGDGAYDSPLEDATAPVSVPGGDHVYYLRAQDAGGTWGPWTTALVSGADQGGPTTTAPLLTPNLVKGTNTQPVALTATGDDSTSGGNNVTAGEYFIDSAGVDGSGNAMSVDQAATVAALSATIPTSTLDGLSEGAHAIYLHAQDSQGNWGDSVTVNLTVDETGPSTSGITVSPSPNNGTLPFSSSVPGVRVAVPTMSDPLSGGVNSPIAAAEGFIDTVGATGSGIRLTPSNGTFTTTTEGGYFDIPLSTVAAMSNGAHTISVHARDAAGNWGPMATGTLVVDKTKPAVSAVTASPNPTAGEATVTLTATGTDGGTPSSGITAAEWWRGTDPGVGKGTSMTVTGSGPGYTATATVDVASLPEGTATLKVRVRDGAGNWSTAGSTDLVVRHPLWYSTFGNSNPPGVAGTADDSDLYAWSGTAHSRAVDLSLAPYSVPAGANVDGLSRTDGTHFYLSFADNTSLPGLGSVQDEDVVLWNAGSWQLYFDGTAHGLTAANLDLDAISVDGSTLYFSTLGNTNPPGVTGTADDADVYSWNGTAYARDWDATTHGVPGAANADGLDRVDATRLHLSFAADTTVTGLGTVQDEDVLYVAGNAWSVFFDGTARGLTSANLDVDAFDVY
ncbi:multicopper oxidase domain-containing protein [Nocardioides taihuensis]|uniref:Multicopper oxidase domain-containing protein n=1 Tax=Nocardioides taihuensis TaxID=1835606 RepID=A0ABW0BJ51_9ACTN